MTNFNTIEEMSPQERAKLAALLHAQQITKLGFAGITTTGHIVDRREQPEAIPLIKNDSLLIPMPKCIDCEEEFKAHYLEKSLCNKCRKKLKIATRRDGKE